MRRSLGGSVAYFERDRVASVDVVQSVELPAGVTINTVSTPWG